MPSPVEALPCGSRSISSTRQPVAASAVARLIAVVVLPTPPFWLATAIRIIVFPSALRRTPLATMIRGIGVGEARFETEITLPRRSRRIQFGLGVSALGKDPDRPGRGKTLRQRRAVSASGAKARALITSNGARRHRLELARRGSRPVLQCRAAMLRLRRNSARSRRDSTRIDLCRVQQRRRSAPESPRPCRDRARFRPRQARSGSAGPNRGYGAPRRASSEASGDEILALVLRRGAARRRPRAARLFHVEHRARRLRVLLVHQAALRRE